MRRASSLLICASATIALFCAGAFARPSIYQCDEDLEVKIDFTPRTAQLHLRDKDYTLQRVKSAKDGHYVSGKQGVEVVANKSDLRLREGKQTLQCKLKVTP